MATQRVFSTLGGFANALEVDANDPNTTGLLATSTGPNSTSIQIRSTGPNSTGLLATLGEPPPQNASAQGGNATGACVHAISTGNLPALLAENASDGIAITAKGTPALDAFDNPPNNTITIGPGDIATSPSDGSISIVPSTPGFVGVIQARATDDLVAGIKAAGGTGPGIVASSGVGTGVAAFVGLIPDPNLMGAGHALAGSTTKTGAAGLFATSANGPAIEASSPDTTAIQATSTSGSALSATSTSGAGARISSQQASGVSVAVGLPTDVGLDQLVQEAFGHAVVAITNIVNAAGLFVQSFKGPGAKVFSQQGVGMTVSVGVEPFQLEQPGTALVASTNALNATGLVANSLSGPAITAHSESGVGIQAISAGQTALIARSGKGTGAVISSEHETALVATVGLAATQNVTEAGLQNLGHAIAASVNTPGAAALFARNKSGTAVEATSDGGIGVDATSVHGTAIRARAPNGVGLSVEGLLQVTAPAVGTVTAQGGETVLQVQSAAATGKSTILLTPLGNPKAFLWINSRASGSFAIGASQPLPTGLVIHYLVIN